jgi:hypothetical protein
MAIGWRLKGGFTLKAAKSGIGARIAGGFPFILFMTYNDMQHPSINIIVSFYPWKRFENLYFPIILRKPLSRPPEEERPPALQSKAAS